MLRTFTLILSTIAAVLAIGFAIAKRIDLATLQIGWAILLRMIAKD